MTNKMRPTDMVGLITNLLTIGGIGVAAVTKAPLAVWMIIMVVSTIGMTMWILRAVEIYSIQGLVGAFSRRSAAIVAAASSPAVRLTLINPRYEADLVIDGNWDFRKILGSESVVIVIGGNPACELLDRPVAARLRDVIDGYGGKSLMRRAVVVTYQYWLSGSGRENLRDLPTLSIGHRTPNPLTGEIEDERKRGGEFTWPQGTGFASFNPRTSAHGPRAAMWGTTAAMTRSAVEGYTVQPHGLREFLRDHAGWT